MSEIRVDTIAEKTSANGVAIDSVTLKDGGVTTTELTMDGLSTKVAAGDVMFQGGKVGNHTLTNGTYTLLDFSTEGWDRGNNFASNTFTAPVTGKYLLHVRLCLQSVDSSASYYLVNITTSNRSHTFIEDPRGLDADPNYFVFNVTAVADMDTNDTATVTIIQPNGTAQTDVLSTGSYTAWYGYLLG